MEEPTKVETTEETEYTPEEGTVKKTKTETEEDNSDEE